MSKEESEDDVQACLMQQAVCQTQLYQASQPASSAYVRHILNVLPISEDLHFLILEMLFENEDEDDDESDFSMYYDSSDYTDNENYYFNTSYDYDD